MWQRYLLVVIGGAAGAVARYAVGGWIGSRLGAGFPWGTLAINLSGSFLLGCLSALATERLVLPPSWVTLPPYALTSRTLGHSARAGRDPVPRLSK